MRKSFPPALVLSLDFELHWGVRDHLEVGAYRQNLLGAREAVLRLLDLFARRGIEATWATVGFLFAEDREELLEACPAVRPRYRDGRLCPYAALGELGTGEQDDPFHYAPSLVRAIAQGPGQELATHTFSHFYCQEPGASLEAFEADLRGALRLGRAKGHHLESIVFPRNQYTPEHLRVLKRCGITSYRGNPDAWIYRPRPACGESLWQRGARLLDAHAPVSGAPVPGPGYVRHSLARDGVADVPASLFLRPWTPGTRDFASLRLDRIRQGMTRAARTGGLFHLWWHPHNFGQHLPENLAALGHILDHYDLLRDTWGMTSWSMRSYAAHTLQVDAMARPTA